MSDKPKIRNEKFHSEFSRKVSTKAARKLRAQRNSKQGIWVGLGMMGLIGWSVAVPTLLGAGLGIWLDNSHPGHYSWTLILLVSGLVVGSLNALHWVTRENKEMNEEEKEDNDE